MNIKKLRAFLGRIKRKPYQIIKDYKIVNSIRNKNIAGRKIYYFGVPEHSNLGDMAQCYCIRRYFKKFFPEYTVVEILTRNYLDNCFGLRNYLNTAIRPNDLIFFQSGYCTQDLGGREDLMHQAVIRDFPDNILVMFPQTVYFKSEKRKEQASKVYDAHRRLYFLARDEISYAYAKDMFPHITIECYPDIVTSLIGHYMYSFDRQGILFCIRNDSEKYYTDEEIEKLKLKFQGVEKCERLDTSLHISPEKMQKNLQIYLEDFIQKFARYKLIITDRYHGTIFSLVANTPVIVIKTSDHKVKTGVDWFKDVYHDQVCFAETLDDAYILADRILKEHKYNQNVSYFEQMYYAKLRKKIFEVGVG